jgi:hypothetical protein
MPPRCARPDVSILVRLANLTELGSPTRHRKHLPLVSITSRSASHADPFQRADSRATYSYGISSDGGTMYHSTNSAQRPSSPKRSTNKFQ